jgi:hypothetical protein
MSTVTQTVLGVLVILAAAAVIYFSMYPWHGVIIH